MLVAVVSCCHFISTVVVAVLPEVPGPPQVLRLTPHLPPSHELPQEVLTSPQFQQALGVFGSALHSGQLGPLMAQFGMGEEVARAATTGGEACVISVFCQTGWFMHYKLIRSLFLLP